MLWRNSSLCNAGAEGAGGPDCWGTSLPSKPSRQTSVEGNILTVAMPDDHHKHSYISSIINSANNV